MGQEDVLINSLDLPAQMAGPAKLLYAPGTLPMPIRAEEVIDPTTGAPATGWTAFGITRGGVNVGVRTDKQVYDDIDQIIGEWGQRTTNRGVRVTTQIGEVLNTTQTQVALEMGTPTVVVATTVNAGGTQVLQPLHPDSEPPRRRLAIVKPKKTVGRVHIIVLRQVEPAGSDHTWRFDKSDKVSPGAEFIAFPEIATTIPAGMKYGYRIDMAGED
jgi:hypothetical protein